MKKIGVMTCGGDCPGLNATIYALKKILKDQLVGIQQNAINGGKDNYKIVSLDQLTPCITTMGGTMLGSTVESDLKRHDLKRFDALLNDLEKTIKGGNIDILIVIAGDGGIHIMSQVCKKIDVPFIAIPKTIDNDVMGTDYAIGFQSAIEHITMDLNRLSTTIMSHKRVMVAEVMGRDAGFIALHAGLSASADAILIPEISYDIDKLAEFINQRYKETNQGVLIVIAEGIMNPEGDHTYIRQKRYGGVGQSLSTVLEEKTNYPTRYVRLGHLQRGGSPCAFDRFLACRMACETKNLIDCEEFGKMVILKNNTITSIPIPSHLRASVSNLEYWKDVLDKLGVFIGE